MEGHRLLYELGRSNRLLLYILAPSGTELVSSYLRSPLPKDLAYDHYFYDPQNPSDPRTNLDIEEPVSCRISRTRTASMRATFTFTAATSEAA